MKALRLDLKAADPNIPAAHATPKEGVAYAEKDTT